MTNLDIIIGTIGITLIALLVYLQKFLRKRYNQRMDKQREYLNKVVIPRAGKLRATEHEWSDRT